MAFKLLLRLGPHISTKPQRRALKASKRHLAPSKLRAHASSSIPGPATTASGNSAVDATPSETHPPLTDPLAAAPASQGDKPTEDDGLHRLNAAGTRGDSPPYLSNPSTAAAGEGSHSMPASHASPSGLQGLRAPSFMELCEQFDEWIGTRRVLEAMDRAGSDAWALQGPPFGMARPPGPPSYPHGGFQGVIPDGEVGQFWPSWDTQEMRHARPRFLVNPRCCRGMCTA